MTEVTFCKTQLILKESPQVTGALVIGGAAYLRDYEGEVVQLQMGRDEARLLRRDITLFNRCGAPGARAAIKAAIRQALARGQEV